MSAKAACFLEPLDVLLLRGNKLFGDAGSFGESLVPPWPSVAAGAVRSRLLVDAGIDPQEFAQGKVSHPELGSPSAPSTFRVTAFDLARQTETGEIEVLVACPADLLVKERPTESARSGNTQSFSTQRLKPQTLPVGLLASQGLSQVAILPESQRSKPSSGYWLTQAGWLAYLSGKELADTHLVSSKSLWSYDERVGVGLDPEKRRAADGQLFSVQAVAMRQGVGFRVQVTGARLPESGLVRLGGDGRAAAVKAAAPSGPVAAVLDQVIQQKKARLVLTTPGVFAHGWLPTGARADGSFELHGVKARLVCAAVPRHEVVSGWDLAQRAPKAAQRVAPTGSVYWLEQIEASRESLAKLVEHGLWSEACEDVHRRAEGFNRLALAVF